jgi:hypothetical protein
MNRPDLQKLARWLLSTFEQPPEEFEDGRRKLRDAIADHLASTPREAGDLLEQLECEGYLRYAAEGRSIGGSAGRWVVYTEPDENPEEPGVGGAPPDPC